MKQNILTSLVNTARTRSVLAEYGPIKPPIIIHIPAVPKAHQRLGVDSLVKFDLKIIQSALQTKNETWFESEMALKKGPSSLALSMIGIPKSAEFEACNGFAVSSPIMQVGTDFYLGTSSILLAIERRIGFQSLFPSPELVKNPSGRYPRFKEAEFKALQMWTDSSLKSLFIPLENEFVSDSYVKYCLKIVSTLLREHSLGSKSIYHHLLSDSTEENKNMIWTGLYGPSSSIHIADIYVGNVILALMENPNYKRVILNFPDIIAWLDRMQEFFTTSTVYSFPLDNIKDMERICTLSYMRNEYGSPSQRKFEKWNNEGPDVNVILSTGQEFTGNFVAENDWEYSISRQLLFNDFTINTGKNPLLYGTINFSKSLVDVFDHEANKGTHTLKPIN